MSFNVGDRVLYDKRRESIKLQRDIALKGWGVDLYVTPLTIITKYENEAGDLRYLAEIHTPKGRYLNWCTADELLHVFVRNIDRVINCL